MKKISVYKTALFSALALASFTTQAAQGPWLVRVRAIDVIPYASSNNLNTVNGKVSDISSKVAPELDISYFITPNIAAELILATSKHNVKATGTTLGTVDLGDATILPPTLTLQYHFMPDCKVRPYIGAGLNYTYFYNISRGPSVNAISYASSFGPALQAGADFMIDTNWSVNVDVKKIYVQSNVNADLGSTHLSPTVALNPIVIGIGVGYRFGA